MLLSRRLRKSLLLLFLSLFCLLQLLFVTIWSPSSFERSSRTFAKRITNPPKVKPFFQSTRPSEVRTIEAEKTAVPLRQNEQKKEDTIMRKVLAPYINQSQGRVLSMEFTQNQATKENSEVNSQDVLDVVYKKPTFPKKFDVTKLNSVRNPSDTAMGSRYVYVYYRYWEQLIMNTRNLISLAGQAKIGGRTVVQPMVKDSSFASEGNPLGIYFDVAHMNKILAASGYAILADKKKYVEECSLSSASHATLHFLYNQDKAEVFTKENFGLSDEEYTKISEMAKENGWTECTFMEKYLKLKPGSKQYCVDPTVITDWDVLEQRVLKGVVCVGIALWRGIGGGIRTSFSEKHLRIPSRGVQFLLKQSPAVLSEVERFKRAHLSDQYIAIHVRGEKVVIPHNLKRLKKCLSLVINVIQVLKQSFGINKVFVATDMSSYGSGSWKNSLREEKYNDNTLNNLHNNLISRSGAVVYKPAAGQENLVDRGAISLIDMSLISQAEHLVTIGSGSFQEWVVAKFLEMHQYDIRKQWSLARICLE